VAASSVAAFAALLYAETRNSYLPTLLSNQGYIPIVQGRYFIPVAIPALVAISGRKLTMRAGWFALILCAVIVLANVSAMNALTATYYSTVPPSSRYEHQLVRRPGDSPEDTKIYVVMDGKKRWVVHGEWFAAHGYRWPDDVHVIPADDLDAIVTGLPVHEQR